MQSETAPASHPDFPSHLPLIHHNISFLLHRYGLVRAVLPAFGTGSSTCATETKRPDMAVVAKDTAPKYNATAHVRVTTKEEAGNAPERDILVRKYSEAQIRAALAAAGPFQPFPATGDEAYRALPADERAAIIAQAETYLGYDWPTLTAMRYLDHDETGSLRAFQMVYFE